MQSHQGSELVQRFKEAQEHLRKGNAVLEAIHHALPTSKVPTDEWGKIVEGCKKAVSAATQAVTDAHERLLNTAEEENG